MHRTFAGLSISLASLALVACGPPKPVDFSLGVPTKEQATVAVPTSTSSGLSEAAPGGSASEQLAVLGEAAHRATAGEIAGLYQLTRGATYLVNGSTVWLLEALAAGVARRPTSVSGNTAVFGPYTPYLSQITWKLTVTRTEFNAFSYLLEGQDKTQPGGPWVPVISGSHTVTVDAGHRAVRGFGEGVFLIEWDQANRLPGRGGDTGTCEVHYGKVDHTTPAYVNVSFNNVAGGSQGTNFNAEYRFALQPELSGTFEFALDLNLHPFDPAMQAQERWGVKSRWMSTGAGRSDVNAHDGDLTIPVTVNECWDAAFLSTYYARSDDPAQGYGVEAQSCAFPTADYSPL